MQYFTADMFAQSIKARRRWLRAYAVTRPVTGHKEAGLARRARAGWLLALVAVGCGRLQFADVSEVTGDAAPARDASADMNRDANVATLLVGCEAWFAMDEASWLNPLIDACGTNAGNASGGALPVDDPIRGRVGELVGGNSCITVADTVGLRGGAALTMSAWVRPSAVAPGSFGIMSKRIAFGDSTAYSMFLWTDTAGTGATNHLYVDIDGEAERFELLSDTFLNDWHQVTTVFDGGKPMAQRIAIYVDGSFRTFAPEAAASITNFASVPALAIGCLPLNGPAQSLVGRIDDVVLWSRALPAQDVAAWHTATVK